MSHTPASYAQSVIPKALEYYDTIGHLYRDLFRQIDSYRYRYSKDPALQNYVEFYDKHNNLLGQSAFQLLGVYSPKNALWAWGWSIPTIPSNRLRLSRRLLTYGLDNEDAVIRSELVNSRFTIKHAISLDVHLALASYLTQRVVYAAYDFVDPADRGNYRIEYIFLTDFSTDKLPDNWGVPDETHT